MRTGPRETVERRTVETTRPGGGFRSNEETPTGFRRGVERESRRDGGVRRGAANDSRRETPLGYRRESESDSRSDAPTGYRRGSESNSRGDAPAGFRRGAESGTRRLQARGDAGSDRGRREAGARSRSGGTRESSYRGRDTGSDVSRHGFRGDGERGTRLGGGNVNRASIGDINVSNVNGDVKIKVRQKNRTKEKNYYGYGHGYGHGGKNHGRHHGRHYDYDCDDDYWGVYVGAGYWGGYYSRGYWRGGYCGPYWGPYYGRYYGGYYGRYCDDWYVGIGVGWWGWPSYGYRETVYVESDPVYIVDEVPVIVEKEVVVEKKVYVQPGNEPPAAPPPEQAAPDQGEPLDPVTEKYLQEGSKFFVEKNYHEAAMSFRMAVVSSPKAAAPRFAFGQALIAMGDYPYAARILRSALDQEPGVLFAPGTIVSVYADPEEFFSVLGDLKTAQMKEPEDADLLFLVVYQHYFSRDPQAVPYFERLKKVAPADPAVTIMGPAIATKFPELSNLPPVKKLPAKDKK